MSRLSKTPLTLKLRESASLVLLALVIGTALWTVARDWSELIAAGGWFAVFGRFLVVTATLTLLAVVLLIGVGLFVAPVLLMLTLSNALGEKGYAYREMVGRLLGGLQPRRLGRLLIRAADPLWKTLWWAWWFAGTYLKRSRRG